MSRTFSSLLFYFVLNVFGFCAAFNLTILHTNDVHARFEQANKYGGQCERKDADADKCFGGTARQMTIIRETRAGYPNTVLLDGGDQYSGTLWFYKYGGMATAHFMNILGYDIMALGNHEFDKGVSGLIPFLDNVNFTVLSCNIDTTKEPTLTGKFAKRHVLSVGGELIGIVGYTTRETPYISQPGQIDFSDEVRAIQQEVNELTAGGINKIIAVGHSGFVVDEKIAREVKGVDVVVGGHSNTFLYTGAKPSNEDPEGSYPHVVAQDDGKKVLVVQDYAYGKYMGFLQVDFDDNGVITAWNGNPILLDKTVKRDPAMLAAMEPYRQGVINETYSVIGQTHVDLEGSRLVCKTRECNLGNLITDGMVRQNLRHSDSLYWNNVSIAIMNSGGIRASINRGDITIGAVLTVLPFSNTIDIVELKGTHLKGALEHSASKYSTKSTDLWGAFLQVSGIRVTYDISRPPGKRVIEAKVKCTKCPIPRFVDIDDDEVYQVIMPSFVANGGDEFLVIKNNKIRHHLIGDLDSDVFIEYAKAYSPIIHGEEGRTTVVNGTAVCVKWSTDKGDQGDKGCVGAARALLHSTVFILLSVMLGLMTQV